MEYTDNIGDIDSSQLRGFFVGWKSPLSPERHYDLLRGSTHFIVALDNDKVAGFITALTDGVNSSFIPLLEVLPGYQSRGIGSELFRRMLVKLENISNIDLMCDPEMQQFYEKFNMIRTTGNVNTSLPYIEKGYLLCSRPPKVNTFIKSSPCVVKNANDAPMRNRAENTKFIVAKQSKTCP